MPRYSTGLLHDTARDIIYFNRNAKYNAETIWSSEETWGDDYGVEQELLNLLSDYLSAFELLFDPTMLRMNSVQRRQMARRRFGGPGVVCI